MGKAEGEQSLSTAPSSSEDTEGNACGSCHQCRSIGRIVRPRCVVALVLGFAILLSAVFWLPPFLRHSGDLMGRNRDPRFKADIVASFRLQKPVAMLSANISKLQYDIYEEIGVPNSLVVVSSLEPLAGSNWTTVVFGIWPYPKNLPISSAEISLLRESFTSLVTRQSTLHLTTSLFGNSSFFEVLKFPGGITIIPPQNAFLLQKLHSLFNFSLNVAIDQVQDKLSELKDQMKLGLLLNSYENLYVRLTNIEGSTVAPPTTLETFVVLKVGNNQPSLSRLKQLAKSISNSSAGNLGLNHTVFGKVKQVRLSSFFQHSLNSGGSSSPSPTPQPQPDHHHRHHHHHHHHHHSHPDTHLAPAAPPRRSYQTPAPSRCRFGYSNRPKSKAFLVPAAAPAAAPQHSDATVASPQHSAAPESSPQNSASPEPVPQHSIAPHVHENSPAPDPDMRAASPLPAAYFAHVQPPSESVTDVNPPDRKPSISPVPHSSSASGQPSIHWVLAVLLFYLLMRI
ncbi:uncharacterized protein LOC103711710 [Phoenix dactylifera]|uniref:Uncharacterized protein LOC103711710 n=1 Tax=Phoenix dactylifera TaxID=42345 RepID=A0A8B7CC98_PHODC|nr:uncharacterized protein LOC103711710 [Phoenix dactylifera]